MTFACHETDENGFVIDFGKLKYIKNWIDEHLDHACLFNQEDSDAQKALKDHGNLFKIYTHSQLKLLLVSFDIGSL